MSNKSSKSPTGEEREQQSEHVRDQGVEKRDIVANSGMPASNPKGDQENLKNRGYQEDQPGNPIRNNGSMRREHESPPTGEPDPGEF